ncbi:MAG: hypothetical protein ABI813_07610 [Bacteroidota bacterium]
MKNKNKNTSKKNEDIKDSFKDRQKLQSEQVTIDMPEVQDIPGQEHIQPPRFGEMADTTISSADEEGAGILDDLNTSDQNTITNSSDITKEERKLLKKSEGHQPTDESRDFDNMVLDDRDNEGELLNEKSIKQDRHGEDLDTPGTELDDEDENIGEEDEENNNYSQRD